MPVHCDANVETARFIVTFTGEVEPRDLLVCASAQRAAGAWTWPAVVDLSRVTAMRVTIDDLEALVKRVLHAGLNQPARGPVVILAPHPLAYGFGRMYQQVAEPSARFPLFVAQSANELEEWLAAQA